MSAGQRLAEWLLGHCHGYPLLFTVWEIKSWLKKKKDDKGLCQVK